MNDGTLTGFSIGLSALVVFIVGCLNPTICGSGNCIESTNFYLIFGIMFGIGLLIMILSLLMETK